MGARKTAECASLAPALAADVKAQLAPVAPHLPAIVPLGYESTTTATAYVDQSAGSSSIRQSPSSDLDPGRRLHECAPRSGDGDRHEGDTGQCRIRGRQGSLGRQAADHRQVRRTDRSEHSDSR